MECCAVKDRLSLYVDGALDEHTLELIEEHIGNCEICRNELVALQRLVNTTGEIKEIEPPVSLKSSILSAVAKESAKASECERVSGLLSAFVDGELSASHRREVLSHVKSCKNCESKLVALETLIAAAGEVEMVSPPSNLRQRIFAATSALPAEPKRLVFADWLAGLVAPRNRWATAAAAAGVMAIAVATGIHDGQDAAKVARVDKPAIVAPPAAQNDTQIAETPKEQPTEKMVASSAARNGAGSRIARNRGDRTRQVVAVAPSVKPALPKPATKPVVTGLEPKDKNETTAVADPVTEPAKTDSEPVEVAAAPAPAPEIQVEREVEEPVLIKVASAPAIDQQDPDEWAKQIKEQAAMRKSGRRGQGGMNIFSARF